MTTLKELEAQATPEMVKQAHINCCGDETSCEAPEFYCDAVCVEVFTVTVERMIEEGATVCAE